MSRRVGVWRTDILPCPTWTERFRTPLFCGAIATAHLLIYFVPKVLPAPTPCKHMVSDLFHRPSGLLFTFPSRYLFTIGLEKYLVLPVSSGGFPRAFRVPGYLRMETKKIFYFCLRDYHPLGFVFPNDSTNKRFFDFSAINSTSPPCNPHLYCYK